MQSQEDMENVGYLRDWRVFFCIGNEAAVVSRGWNRKSHAKECAWNLSAVGSHEMFLSKRMIRSESIREGNICV